MNGEDACAAVSAMSEMGESYLLITMDLSMPKCNGLEAAKRMRVNLYRGTTTPIVALSGFDLLQPIPTCARIGMPGAEMFCKQIQKPLTPPKASEVDERGRAVGWRGMVGMYESCAWCCSPPQVAYPPLTSRPLTSDCAAVRNASNHSRWGLK